MARPRSSKVIVHVTSEAVSKPETVVLKITVPLEVKRVLQIEALGRDCSVGAVVAELVKGSPRRFVLSERGAKPLRPEVPSEPESQPALLVRGDPWPMAPDSSEVA